jgi:CheY-like chemotaxis protein
MNEHVPGLAANLVNRNTSRMPIIAIVEDTADSADIIHTVLQQICRIEHVHCFADGKRFLETFRSTSFDLILLDIAMPGMDGYAVLRCIREVNQTVPVIAVTSYAFADDIKRARAAGFSDYVTKPITNMAAFCALVKSHLDPTATRPRISPADEFGIA